MNLSGASIVEKTSDFIVHTAVIKSSGSSIVSINATDALNIDSSGALTVHYKGAPVKTIKNKGTLDMRFGY